MIKLGTRVKLKDGRQGVIVKPSWLRRRPGYSFGGTLERRVRLDDGSYVYRDETQLEQVR